MNAITDSAAGHDLVIQTVEAEPRILDTDLAERLGFAKPTKIRDLIKRHHPALSAMGTVPTVGTVSRGQKGVEFYLNRKQAIFITAKSGTPTATDITIEVIEKFDAYERGTRPASGFNVRDRGQLLGLALELTQELQASQIKVEILKGEISALGSKAAAWARIGDSSGMILPSNFAKTAGVGPGWLSKHLEHGICWCFRRDNRHGGKGPLVAYQRIVDHGWMVHKLAEYTRPDGSTGTRDQAYLTPAGAAKLAELLERCNDAATIRRSDPAVS